MKSKTPKNPTPADRLEQLRAALEELRLRDMRAQFDLEVDDTSEEPWLERLWRLVDAQLRARRERAMARRIKAARFPAHKTLDAFDFNFQTGVDRDQLFSLATLDWLDRRQSVLFGGMSGTGKSHLAIALGHLACVHGYSVRYVTSGNMLTELHLALTTRDLQQAVKPFTRCDLLVIDEVGLDQPERQVTKVSDASLFYKVMAARYAEARSCIITTNIAWDHWGEYLGDDVATAAILDRLVHHSHAITIDGPSWRAHQHTLLNNASEDADPVGD